MAEHTLGLRYSDDGGYNFTSFREKDIGEAGQFNVPLRYLRLGSFQRQRVYEIECTSPRQCAILGAVMIADSQE